MICEEESRVSIEDIEVEVYYSVISEVCLSHYFELGETTIEMIRILLIKI